MQRLWVSLAGVAGVGKSTLARRVGTSLSEGQFPVDVFGEEELFVRAAFAGVADLFRGEQEPMAGDLERSYGAWLTGLPASTVAITDWSPAGMAGDLSWAANDPTGFVQHLGRVRSLADGRVLLLHLQAQGDTALDRASAERGAVWSDRADQIARDAGHPQLDARSRVLAEYARHAAQTTEEVNAAAEAGWTVLAIDTARPAHRVAAVALTAIATALGRTG